LFRSLIARISGRARLLATIGLAILAVALYGAIHFRLTMDDRGSAAARGPLNWLAVSMIQDNPLLGVGANNFSVAMQPYVSHGFFGEFLYTVHNRYLLIWSETGVVGLITYLWFLIATLQMGWRSWRRRDLILSPLALACTAALGAFMFHMFWEAFRGLAVLQMSIVLAALLAVLDRLTARARSSVGELHPLAH
jgi:O-antigen ligase